MAVNSSQLERDLQSHGICLEKWGEVRETLLHLLAAELNEGDSILEIGQYGLVRVVHEVQIIIREAILPDVQKDASYPLKHLLEIQRVYPGGRYEHCHRYPSGKIRVDETRQQALTRKLEWLFLRKGDYRFSFIRTEEPKIAPSARYPGLITRYLSELYFVQTTPYAAKSFALTREDHGVVISHGWETTAEFHARVEREKALTQNV